MKKQLNLCFFYDSKMKPGCEVFDRNSAAVLACVSHGGGWKEVEKAAIAEAKKHFTYGPVPSPKTIEIEIPDPKPVELKEEMVEAKKDNTPLRRKDNI